MPYTRRYWVDGEIITSEKLNNIEEGITEAQKNTGDGAGSAANKYYEAHMENKDNPHEITAKQVGLENVPNVSTNNQTPTYTEAKTLATLTSGEKLSVAFGKIKLAITKLIEHLSNKENPHGVTLSQLSETTTRKIMTGDEREKLKGIAKGANSYTHPDTHPASMITGMEERITELGYKKIASGSYVGDGTGVNEYTYMSGLKEWGAEGFSCRTIELPFAPSILIMCDENSANTWMISNGGFLYAEYIYDAGIGGNTNYKSCSVAHLTGNQLQVVYRTFYATGGGDYITGPNVAGKTYNWIIL